MSSYTTTELRPPVPPNSYVHAGRGGAGNTYRAGSTQATTTTTVASTPNLAQIQTSSTSSTSGSGYFLTGRGGAGNARRQPSEPSCDWIPASTSGTTQHVGRGGAGNVASFNTPLAAMAAPQGRKESYDSSASSISSSSTGGPMARIWSRLSGGSR